MKRSSSFFISLDEKDLPLGDLLRRLKSNDFKDPESPSHPKKMIEVENASSISLDSQSLDEEQEPTQAEHIFPSFSGIKDSSKFSKKDI